MKHILFLLALCASLFSFSQQYPLDSTFSGDGIDMLTFDTTVNLPQVVMLPGGKSVISHSMLLPGNSYLSPVLVKYNQNGTLDSTFGVNGIIGRLMNGSDTLSGIANLIGLPDGKFLFRSGTGNSNIGIFRINSNGSIDSTFGVNGIIIFSVSQSGGFSAITTHLLSTNKLLVTAERVDPQDSIRRLILTRYTYDGQLDSSYANNGTSIIPLVTSISQEVFVMPNDDILFSSAGYTSTSTSKFLKVKANGELDTNFANNVPVSPAMLTHGCVELPDGKILFTGRPGYGTPRRMVMRLNANGTLDNTFNGTGYIIMANNSSATPQFFIYGAHLTPDNRIITGYIGYENYQNLRHMGVSMLRPNGTFETSFGTNGTLIVNFPTALDKIAGLAYDRSAGKVMLVGTGMDSTQNYIEILLTARINITAAPPCVTVYSSQNITLCANESYNFNGQLITQAGFYADTLQTADGCDSIINLNVTILPLLTQSQNIMLCEGESVTINGVSYSQTGTITDTIHSTTACDTVKMYHISVIPASPINTISFLTCAGDTFFYNGNAYTVAGTYQDTLTSINGCDSIATIILTFIAAPQASFTVHPDPNTPHNWYALNQSIGDSSLTYTWYWGDGTSDTGSAASHTYASEGYYNICLKVTNDLSCDDTYCDSSTYIFKAESTITINVVNELPTNIVDVNALQINILPNPTNSLVSVTANINGISQLSITDNLGRIVYAKLVHGTLREQVDMSTYSNGVYLLRIVDANGKFITRRIVKQ